MKSRKSVRNTPKPPRQMQSLEPGGRVVAPGVRVVVVGQRAHDEHEALEPHADRDEHREDDQRREGCRRARFQKRTSGATLLQSDDDPEDRRVGPRGAPAEELHLGLVAPVEGHEELGRVDEGHDQRHAEQELGEQIEVSRS